MEVLAPDVAWIADGAGRVSAARRPVVGSEKVTRLILGLLRMGGEGGNAEIAFYNGAPALVLFEDGGITGVVNVEMRGGRITHFYVMRDPEKLRGVRILGSIAR